VRNLSCVARVIDHSQIQEQNTHVTTSVASSISLPVTNENMTIITPQNSNGAFQYFQPERLLTSLIKNSHSLK
jgi:hypothetical protein